MIAVKTIHSTTDTVHGLIKKRKKGLLAKHGSQSCQLSRCAGRLLRRLHTSTGTTAAGLPFMVLT